jgi:hypothetical protein
MSTAAINILRTAGWDSTFRILWLTLKERKPVQPYYFVNSCALRTSALVEIHAMRNIRHLLHEKDQR